MARISRVSLFGKLNPVLYKAIESATVFAKLRCNPIVDVSHWLYQIVLICIILDAIMVLTVENWPMISCSAWSSFPAGHWL